MTSVERVGPFGLFWRRRIYRDGELYLDRYSLRKQRAAGGGGWRIYLHRFWQADSPPLHNHPWTWSFALVLLGRYWEEYQDAASTELQRPFGFPRLRCVTGWNWISARRFHRISTLVPGPGKVWTLFVCGPLHGRSWGFFREGHYVNNRDRSR